MRTFWSFMCSSKHPEQILSFANCRLKYRHFRFYCRTPATLRGRQLSRSRPLSAGVTAAHWVQGAPLLKHHWREFVLQGRAKDRSLDCKLTSLPKLSANRIIRPEGASRRRRIWIVMTTIPHRKQNKISAFGAFVLVLLMLTASVVPAAAE